MEIEQLYQAFASFLLWIATVATYILEIDEDEQEEEPDVDAIAEAVGALRRIRKRAFDGEESTYETENPPKRKKHDYERGGNTVREG